VALNEPAGAGLSVVAYPTASPDLETTAFSNNHGVYSFVGLPGLRRVENGAGDDAFWAANPPSVNFTLEVNDPNDRYLPFSFSVKLPARGLFGFVSSPPFVGAVPDSSWVPVFSTVSRTFNSLAATIHAQLQDDGPKTPAAWALVSAQFTGARAMLGVADGRGMVTLSIPYPEPPNSPFTSPMGPGSLKLTDQKWPITIAIFYTPQPAPKVIPDLEKTLNQRVANVWAGTNHAVAAGGFTVNYGQELILRSLNSTNGQPLPVLLITTAP
jgi:hypothetical protein